MIMKLDQFFRVLNLTKKDPTEIKYDPLIKSKRLMRVIARLGLRGLLLGLDLLTQLREFEGNISKQIKFQFECRNLNTQVILNF